MSFEDPTLNVLQVEAGDLSGWFCLIIKEIISVGICGAVFQTEGKAIRQTHSLGYRKLAFGNERYGLGAEPPSFPWRGNRHCQKHDSSCQKCMKSALQMVKQKSQFPLFCDRVNISNFSSKRKWNSNTSHLNKRVPFPLSLLTTNSELCRAGQSF